MKHKQEAKNSIKEKIKKLLSPSRAIHKKTNPHRPPRAAVATGNVFIVSNESPIKFDDSDKFSHGKFVLVGCSGLKSLDIIKNLINWELYQKPSEQESNDFRGYTNIPKLFIIDNTKDVIEYWDRFKTIFFSSSNLKEFDAAVLAYFMDKNEDMIRVVAEASLVWNFFINLFGSDETMYQFMRNVVAKSSIVPNDWRNDQAFSYFQDRYTMPVCVYASNIAEYLAVGQPVSGESELNTFLKNICVLNPSLTIHTRTPLSSEVYHISGFLEPTCTLISKSAQPSTQLALLHGPSYIPLCQALSVVATEPGDQQSNVQSQMQSESSNSRAKI